MTRKKKIEKVEAKAELVPLAAEPVVEVDELPQKVEEAKASGAYMVAVWRVSNGQLHFFRTTHRFPVDDLGEAVRQLQADLGPMMLQRQ